MVAAKNSVIMRKDARLAMKRKEGRKDEPAEEDEQIDQRMMYRRRLQDTIPEWRTSAGRRTVLTYVCHKMSLNEAIETGVAKCNAIRDILTHN